MLPPSTTSQQAELIALTRALTLPKGLHVNIYTDSKYAFHILHHYAVIWAEIGFLTKQGSSILNAPLIKTLLKATLLPAKVGVIHCKGHQKPSDPITQGNAYADKTAKEAANAPIPAPHSQYFSFSSVTPTYSPTKTFTYQSLPPQSKWLLNHGKFLLSASQAHSILSSFYDRFQSDKGQAFISQITQAVGIQWNLHTPYHPQSSGKVERNNGLLKTHLTKLSLQLKKDQMVLLPLAHLRIWATPQKPAEYSPFELLHGHTFLLGPNLIPDNSPFCENLPILQQARREIRQAANLLLPTPDIQPYEDTLIGQSVLITSLPPALVSTTSVDRTLSGRLQHPNHWPPTSFNTPHLYPPEELLYLLDRVNRDTPDISSQQAAALLHTYLRNLSPMSSQRPFSDR
ncbi:hypothetical protein AAY473_009490 [Plecturocebus cupreus]